MRFAICDDNKEHIDILRHYFDQRPELAIEVESYTSGEALVSDYRDDHRRYDALFIDMEMGEMNGIDTANAIRAIDERVIIVFVTSHKKYMQDSFKCLPFRFLTKPLVEKDLEEAVRAIIKRQSETRSVVHLNINKEQVRLYCDEILYCECRDHQIFIVSVEERYHVNMTISKLMDLLDPAMFARTHKAFIVNLHYIKRLSNSQITLRGSDVIIPVGRAYKDNLMRAFAIMKERELCV